MKINDKIRVLRESRSWSQEDMAIKLGMSTNGYSKIERGESQVSLQRLEVIAAIFEMDTIELMALGEERKIIFLNSNNSPNSNCSNYFGSEQDSKMIIHNLQIALSHKDELLSAKEREIDNLKEIIQLLKTQELK